MIVTNMAPGPQLPAELQTAEMVEVVDTITLHVETVGRIHAVVVKVKHGPYHHSRQALYWDRSANAFATHKICEER